MQWAFVTLAVENAVGQRDSRLCSALKLAALYFFIFFLWPQPEHAVSYRQVTPTLIHPTPGTPSASE
jgi:hypothetical protein